MGEIASSWVSIYPKVTDQFGKQLQTQITKQSGTAFAPIDKKAEESGQSSGKKFGDSFKSALVPIMAVASVGAIADMVGKSVDAYSELQDATAAASVVFGDSMQTIIAQSKTAAAQMGMSQKQVIDAANTFGTFGKSAGLAGDDLAGFSTKMTQVAGDLSSFKGGSPEDAIEAVGAALRGESEPIRRYGILLDDATLRQQALKMGLIETTKSALTPQQRVLAAQAQIIAQATDATGDFARTADSTANVAKTLAAEQANLSAEIGEKLAPAITAAQKAGIGFLTWVEDNQTALVPLAGAVGTVAAALGGFVLVAKGIEALKSARATISGLGDAFGGLGSKARAAGAGIAAGAGVIGVALATATVVYSAFADANSNAKVTTDDFTEALKASNGVIDDNVRAVAAKKLQDSGALDAARQMGVALPDLTDAVLGNADAYTRVQAAMDAWWPSAERAAAWGFDPKWGNLQKVNGALGQLTPAFTAAKSAASNQAGAISNVATTTANATTTTNANTTATKANADATKDATQKLHDLYQARLQARGDQVALEAAIDGATDALKRNGKTLDVNTEKGRANRTALDGIASAGLSYVDSLKASHASTAKQNEAIEEARRSYIRMAEKMGMSSTAARKLADKLGLIKSKNVTVNATVNLKKGTGVTYNAKLSVDGTGAGKWALKARGGAVYGGIQGRDSVPTLLMPGEHVLTTDEVSRLGGQQAVYRLRESIRQGVPRMASGGALGASATAGIDYGPLAEVLVDALERRGISMLTITNGVARAQSHARRNV